ncbi:amino acid ABC transporter substrate-binding protein [Terasakiella pusilla]|uniref:amino acid ABC transporter substrate-binding protein n=1 Tax=Terasakiella pusilla TaxID=64973 RepID=UPI003AA94BA5
MKVLTVRVILFLFSMMALSTPLGAQTLEEIQSRGLLLCGVDEQHYGFAHLDAQGEWVGFEVDFCRALAVAIFNDPTAVTFVPLNAKNRFGALKGREIDVLIRSTSWTFSRDEGYGVDFTNIIYYDRLAILAHKSLKVARLDDVSKASLCVAAGTTTYETVRDYVYRTGKAIRVLVFNSREGLNNLFFSGQCDLYAGDYSGLSMILREVSPNPEDYVFLDTNLSKEPLGPVVREGDPQWFNLVRWMVYGMIEAEEQGITRKNVTAYRANPPRAVKYLLGVKAGFGGELGMRNGWMADVIREIGNYGEVFDRHLGKESALQMERGLNALWKDGGLLYALPVR